MLEFERIGKYEVVDVIGEGGFGVVYKARDPLMERLVAIKVCSTDDEQVRKRFLREAKIAGGLDHPNIVIAYDFGTEKDVPYLVQELLSGEDLRTMIDRKDQIPPAVKLDYLVQIAKALRYAHQQDVLHRDIKPANVRILADNRVKLMDFGMAKITKESGTKLTQDGSVMGTAGYFAPEQLKAIDLDKRVDIFSFGVLAYELLTFNKAFPGDSFMLVFRQVLQDEPEPITSFWSDCPKELADLVEKCMRKEREDRFSSFDEVMPILFSVLGSADFDRRAHRRRSTAAPELAATVLKPVDSIAAAENLDQTIATPVELDRTIIQTDESKRRPKVPDLQMEMDEVTEEQPAEESRAKSAGGETGTLNGAADETGLEPDARPVDSLQVPSAPWREKKGLLAAGILLLLSVAAGILWMLAPSRQRGESISPDESSGVERATSSSSTASGPLFSVFIDATPWGELTQIVSMTGETLPLPDPPFTPAALRLPSGDFTVTIANPRSEEPKSCQIRVSSDSNVSCQVLFEPFDTVEYFKRTGWWE